MSVEVFALVPMVPAPFFVLVSPPTIIFSFFPFFLGFSFASLQPEGDFFSEYDERR